MFAIHLLSALVSSFVFAFAVLEHPKLFARAQDIPPSRIWDWAGVQKIAQGDDRFTSVSGTFVVPRVDGTLDNGAFIGITLGPGEPHAMECGGSSISISVGIVIYIFADGAKFKPVFQLSTGLFQILDEVSWVIQAEEAIGVAVTVVGQSSAEVILSGTIAGTMEPRTASLSLPLPFGSLCNNKVAEWKVGRIKRPLSLTPIALPRFNPVEFSGALVNVRGSWALPAGGQNFDVRPILLTTGEVLVRVRVDESSIEIERVPVP